MAVIAGAGRGVGRGVGRLAGTPSGGRTWHGLTALVALVALVVQLVLVVDGASVLVTTVEPPSTAVRLARFVSYFTVQSNVLVLVATAGLALRPDRDGRLWRVLRGDAVAGIAVTGVVHWFLLRPLLHLTGWSYVADRLLHLAVPLLAVAGWLRYGPRPRLTREVLLPLLAWPLAYLALTLGRGAVTGWYPYPFVDVGVHGYPAVLAACAGVAVLLLAVAVGVLVLESRLGPAPVPRGSRSRSAP